MCSEMNKITLDQYLTSSNKYPARKTHPECTDSVKSNATDLLARINGLLSDIKWVANCVISSGFRTSEANGATSNAAKKSAHMTGKACDIVDDKKQSLSNKIKSRPDLLKKHGLMLEDPTATKGKYTNWCHLDTAARPARASQVFKP